ncbi:hypothetical protein EN980_23315 [Mesorhizobium sp. M7A.F.Ca.CA.001.13.1.1]|uniref:hypothetical protein n=1 Tax=Mesorhizobium sp. M7A.F.Ca.CA.001.13.1.1 TaxID=2496728 RepID=UPI000FCB8DBC|nr:hypothetical protein [Mesorhizobium sp. M7A.F.Ca.CA.001.13.1.1]RUY65228.1 hypothetical protein EN980_23315 [Mesorhizobium sp. M7A.F.Ca.CA.001.13.1.1]
MMLFEPLDSDYHKRSVLYHAARLSMLHDRMLMRFDKVEEAADKVQAAAAVLVDVKHGSAVDALQDAVSRNSSADFLQVEAGQTIGL